MEEELVEPGGSSTDAQRLPNDEDEADGTHAPPSTPAKTEDTAALLPPKSTWTSPLERAAIEMSKRRKMTRMKPSPPYLILSCLQCALGAVIVGVGGAAFATTPTFPAGCFWAGLVILLLSVYSLMLLCLKLAFHKNEYFKKCKHIMYHTLIALCVVCILSTIAASIVDSLAAYMLHRTDFSRCLHTDTPLTVNCDTGVCSNLQLPPNTCYCCFLYHTRKAKGCHTPFLLDKPAYFEGVQSCSVLSDKLYPMLMTVGLLCLLSTALNIVFLFKSRPVRYYVKSEEGEEEVEEEEGVGGLVSKIVQKLKSIKAGNTGKVKYSIANTEDTNID